MGRHDTNFRKAMDELADGLSPALAELAAFNRSVAEAEERGTPYHGTYVHATREQILRRARVGDDNAKAAFRAYRATALGDANALRMAAEAERDPAARMADEMERARLVRSPIDAENFAAQARLLLDGGQPHRAKLMLGVALDKGWKGGIETVYVTDEVSGAKVPTAVSQLQRLRTGIEDALDVAEPKRAEAKAIEGSVAEGEREFLASRIAMLAKHGAGEDRHGAVVFGAREVARASMGAKAAAWEQSVATGKPYSPPEGALASVPSEVYVRARE